MSSTDLVNSNGFFLRFYGFSAVLRIRSGIQCFFDPGIRKRFFPDRGSLIPNPYFLELSDNILGKKFFNSLRTGSNFFLRHFKNKIVYNFVKFVATKKALATNFFHPSLFFAVFGSGIRDLEWVKIRIRDKHPGSANLIFCLRPVPTCTKLCWKKTSQFFFK